MDFVLVLFAYVHFFFRALYVRAAWLHMQYEWAHTAYADVRMRKSDI